MTLAELIAALKKEDPRKVLPLGFKNPHSYRGSYRDLAFEPAENIAVADMLREAEYAFGRMFEGWKGGEYFMGADTDVWIAEEGRLGETVGPILLRLLLERGVTTEKA